MNTTDIAVIGMAGRFPGANSVDELWRNICSGKVSIRSFTPDELRAAGVPDSLAAHPDYVAAGADLVGIEDFDAAFFGIPAHEARLIDPQHRLFLETCWNALEDAGHDPKRFTGRIGLFGSTGFSSYLVNHLARNVDMPADGINFPVLLGNDKDFLCTRVSYRLDLTGPSVTVQSACSSSLVAVHMAVQSLLAGECDLALAGGVSITTPQHTGYLHRDGGILSPDGRCRVFDASAGGTVKGNGCGVVALRRQAESVEDKDRVYAVIRGTAINNDGLEKAGYTAPRVAGQAEAIREALDVAGISPDELDYIEAHGTGTALGDPIEMRALAKAHSVGTSGSCWIGSVKGNVGHLDTAAGVTGLIKAVLVVHHQTVPLQPDHATPNPELSAYMDRYQIPRETIHTPVRAAAVSAFGLGGTNAHVVLSAVPRPQRPPCRGTEYVLALSARDPEALATMAGQVTNAIGDKRLDDVAFTLASGRTRWAHRGYIRASSAGVSGLELGEWPAELGDLSHARRVSLPGHPLRPTRHWVDHVPAEAVAAVAAPPKAGGITVHQIVARQLNRPEIGLDDDLIELGMDSLRGVELVAAIRDETGLELRFEDLDACRTIRQLTAAVEAPQASTPDLLVPLRPGAGDIFLVHPAGGTTIGYMGLARHLTCAQALWGIGFPGSDMGRYQSIRDLARLYVSLVRRQQPHGPYQLAGYSFGASVAFEMAAMLEAAGEKVTRIVMLDGHPPESYVGGSVDDQDYLAVFPSLMAAVLPGAQPMAGTPATLAQALEMIGMPALEQELTHFFGVWQHNHQALKRWYPDTRIAADVVMLAASESEDAEMLERLAVQWLPRETWAAHIAGELRVVPVPGDHYSMLRDEAHLPELAAAFDAAVVTDNPPKDVR